MFEKVADVDDDDGVVTATALGEDLVAEKLGEVDARLAVDFAPWPERQTHQQHCNSLCLLINCG